MLEDVGGTAYLTALLNQVPSSLHADAYLDIVILEKARRDWLYYANSIANTAYNSSSTLDKLEDEIEALKRPNSNAKTGVVMVEDAGIQLMQDLDTAFSAIPCHVMLQDDQGRDYMYGLGTMTQKLGGIPRNFATLVAAPTQTGKTTWGLMQAEVASLCGFRVLYVSTESRAETLLKKRACGMLGISPKLLRKSADPAIDPAEAAYLEQVKQDVKDNINAFIALHTQKLYFDDQSHTVPEIKRSIASLRPDLVIVDHIGELGYDGDSKTIGMADNFQELKTFCKSLPGTALLVFAQIDLSVTARPQLKDIRWAKGDLSEKADIVLLMYRDDLSQARSDDTAGMANAIEMRKYPVPVEFWARKDREGASDFFVGAMFDLVHQLFKEPSNEEYANYFK